MCDQTGRSRRPAVPNLPAQTVSRHIPPSRADAIAAAPQCCAWPLPSATPPGSVTDRRPEYASPFYHIATVLLRQPDRLDFQCGPPTLLLHECRAPACMASAERPTLRYRPPLASGHRYFALPSAFFRALILLHVFAVELHRASAQSRRTRPPCPCALLKTRLQASRWNSRQGLTDSARTRAYRPEDNDCSARRDNGPGAAVDFSERASSACGVHSGGREDSRRTDCGTGSDRPSLRDTHVCGSQRSLTAWPVIRRLSTPSTPTRP